MHAKILHTDRAQHGRTARMHAACWILATLALSACGGMNARIVARDGPVMPMPIFTTNGADAGLVPADALLRSIAARPDATLIEALRVNLRQAVLVAGNRVQILNDGPSTFAAFAAAIGEAEHHVHIETYLFADDELGRSFAELLIAKSREGVEVRVIYDGVGSLTTDSELFTTLRDAGAQVLEFRPPDAVEHLVTGRINNRDHRKLLIVDGRIAFVGGVNISDTYDTSSRSKSNARATLEDGWRDAQLRIEGPAVRQFQSLYLSTFVRSGGSAPEPSRAYMPPLDQVGSSLVAALSSEYGDRTEAAIHAAYVAAIEHAAHRVWITQAYFTPDKALREALISAALRGVNVRILLPGFSDSSLALHASRAIYGELLDGGVQLYEYEDAFVHAKTAVLDDSVAIVGSANLDFRSLLHNNEVVAVVVDTQIADKLAAWFQRDLTDASAITADEWHERPLLQRLKEKVASVFWYWI